MVVCAASAAQKKKGCIPELCTSGRGHRAAVIFDELMQLQDRSEMHWRQQARQVVPRSRQASGSADDVAASLGAQRVHSTRFCIRRKRRMAQEPRLAFRLAQRLPPRNAFGPLSCMLN